MLRSNRGGVARNLGRFLGSKRRKRGSSQRLLNQIAIETLENRTLMTAVYWDPSGAATANGGTGTWNTTTAEWRSGSPTGSLVAWSNTANYDAVFPSSAGTVNLSTGVTVKSLTFNASGYTIAGNTLTFNGGTGQIDVSSGDTATISSVIAGSSGLTKIDSGTLTLSGTDTYTGGTNLSAGQLNINSNGAISSGTFTIAGGTIDNTSGFTVTLSGNNPQIWGGNFTYGGSYSLNLGTGGVTLTGNRTVTATNKNLTVGGVISDGGNGYGITKSSYGMLWLSAANTFSGQTVISNGSIIVSNTNALQDSTVNMSGSGAIAFNSGLGSASLGSLTGSYGISDQDSGSGAVALSIGNNGATNTYTGVISGSGSLKIVGGTEILTGANTYTGTTNVSSGATLQIGSSSTTGNLGTGSVIDGGTLIFSRSNANSVSNTISGAGSVVQSGSGNTTLTGSNTYSGTTNVSGGTLTVDNTSGSGTGTSAVTVYSGGTLRGTGTISGSVSVNSAGIVYPGDSSTAILNVGNFSSASGANLDIAINSSTAGSGYDQLNVTGTVSVTGTYLNLSGTRTNHDGDQIVAINNDGSDAVTGTFNSLPLGSRVVDNSVSYVLSYVGNTGNDVTITDSTPPTAANDNYNAEENITLNQNAAHGVLSNDTGYNGDSLSVYSVDGSTSNVNHVTNSSHGTLTLNSDGSFTYVPQHDYVGVDSASFYVATDGIEQSNSATVQFVIGPGILHATSYTVSGLEGQSTGTVTVAHFTDDAALDSSYYNSQITWGDGTAAQSGTITADGSGGWNVSGSHTYATHGSFNASITVTTNQGGYASVTAAATVSPSIPTVAGGQLMQAIAGMDSGSELLATFTDPYASDSASDYSASIT